MNRNGNQKFVARICTRIYQLYLTKKKCGLSCDNVLLLHYRAVSPVSKYIPSKKIRSFVSTFTEVTNYRLDNLYSSLLPKDWTQWCNDHYSCDQDKNKT